MFLKSSKWILSGLVLAACSFANASTLTLSVDNATQNGSSFGNSFTKSFSVDGENKTLTITAWSDTSSADGSETDVLIQTAQASRYTGGLGITNRNTSGDAHTADNYQSDINKRDYDFFLLDFGDVSVTLNSIFSGFVRDGVASNHQVSVAAVTTGNLGGKTWSEIDNNFSLSSGHGQFIANNGGYLINSFTSEAGENLALTSSTRWIVGALNHHFGGSVNDEGNDSFKLASIGFTTSTNQPGTSPIPEPAPIALMLTALVALSRKLTK